MCIRDSIKTGRLEQNQSAKIAYSNEVSSLNDKLNEAQKNAPRERRALAIANSVVKAKMQDNPDLKNDKKELKKIKQVAINNARAQVGASSKDVKINITDKEWEAIKAGAISDSKLEQILRYADEKIVREKATPYTTSQLSNTQISRAKQMAAMGYTNAEIADIMGKSTSAISKYINS